MKTYRIVSPIGGLMDTVQSTTPQGALEVFTSATVKKRNWKDIQCWKDLAKLLRVSCKFVLVGMEIQLSQN